MWMEVVDLLLDGGAGRRAVKLLEV